MKRFLRSVTLLAILACGCAKSQDPAPAPTPDPKPPVVEKIPIKISSSITKATETAYESGDRIGLFVVNRNNGVKQELKTSGNHVNNAVFSFDGSRWNSDNELYWQDQATHADFYCYYPYASTVSDVHKLPVEVRTDQSAEGGYAASEVLWGKTEDVAPTGNPVSILTRHAFSNLIIILQPGDGYTEESLAADVQSILINNTHPHGTLDLETGTTTVTGSTGDIIPRKENGQYRAMVLPQSLNDQTLVSLQLNGYSFSLKQTITFEANKQHRCTLKVNKTSEGINVGIGAWDVDDNDYGGTLN